MTQKERAVFTASLNHYGMAAQQAMVLEEMSELQKEICKLWRGQDTVKQIAEEVADVEIMLDQLKLMLHIFGEVQSYREQKVERQRQRLIMDDVEVEA